MSRCVGMNLGATKMKIALLGGPERSGKVVAHQSCPLEVLHELRTDAEFAGGEYFGISGRRGRVSEVTAIQRALREVPESFDAVASLGGESFLVYILTDGRITNVLSHNKCAAEHIPGTIFGELIPTVEKGIRAASKGHDGIIVIGPFNCLPCRIAEATLKPVRIRSAMPILTYESDGYAVAPSFLRQIDVHFQQILQRFVANRPAPAAS